MVVVVVVEIVVVIEIVSCRVRVGSRGAGSAGRSGIGGGCRRR